MQTNNLSSIILRSTFNTFFKNTSQYNDEDLEQALVYFQSLRGKDIFYDDLIFNAISLESRSTFYLNLDCSEFLTKVLDRLEENLNYYSDIQ
ncbi:hypothetical protein FDH01_gp126 [Acinetobacter phage vB_AbaM_ME3]|uniref:Uncharacterized protein n=1 Tax=Acinetobacter phage vB_AbaM_ME3 TaxID=1837876 RepID=A0A172Q0B4_9CAUD|nr:hypothetical protein FDH01_gp126 [Acinetobacter phage vB_AbaM_ME3]AND75287.1 hypothetical protein ME3_126 [Acinetobacter phage vB_AbaM_ME3]